MTLKDRINELGWASKGEAAELYSEYAKSPFYDDTEAAYNLLRCLVYEGQYESAAQLALGFSDAEECETTPLIHFFSGVANDMLGNREKAVQAYKRVLQHDDLPPWSFSQFGITLSTEFLEYLVENPYSPENVKKFDFDAIPRIPGLRSLQKQLPVRKTPHFTIYYFPGSSAERDIDKIAEERESAYGKISEHIGLDRDIRIYLWLFEDGDSKTEATGHVGHGLAFERTNVEIYGDEVKLNPYHELVHTLAENMYGNSIPAMSEGLAVYLVQCFCDNIPEDDVDGPYKEKLKTYHKNGELFALRDLLNLNEIGPDGSRPFVSYPQSGSFVEFALDKLGKKKFFELYASINSKNALELVEGAFGQKIEAIEKAWLEYAL